MTWGARRHRSPSIRQRRGRYCSNEQRDSYQQPHDLFHCDSSSARSALRSILPCVFDEEGSVRKSSDLKELGYLSRESLSKMITAGPGFTKGNPKPINP